MLIANWIVLGGLLLGAAGTDLAWRRIPNSLTCIGLGAFALLAGWLYYRGNAEIASGCLLAGALAFFVHLIPYLFHVMGAGDVKLALVTGLLLGWEAWPGYMSVFCLLSLLVSGALLLTGKRKNEPIPLAPVMAAAYMLYWFLRAYTGSA
ncbi:MAG: prepilin peptidase [Clostridiales bacterium]|nr:prepilin peptidase [Clostridiales bacterium]